MGLFGKLFKRQPLDPLSDPSIKTYFEIICGMRKTFLATGAEITTGNIIAKKYVEYFLGEACDEEILEKALELYNVSRVDRPSNEVEKILSNYRKEQRGNSRYVLDHYFALKLFCLPQIDSAAIEYDNILDVIKDNVNYLHFSEGLRTMTCGAQIKNIVIANSFYAGNPITRELIRIYFTDCYRGMKKQGNGAEFTYTVSLLVLKALHFEKYGGNKENYTSISDEDCREFVQSVHNYQEAIDRHPFEKEKYIILHAGNIKKQEVLQHACTSFKGAFHIVFIDDYFCDAVCNFIWKEIAANRRWTDENGEDISRSTNANDAYRVVRTYLDRL